jgi:hypothetical protein
MRQTANPKNFFLRFQYITNNFNLESFPCYINALTLPRAVAFVWSEDEFLDITRIKVLRAFLLAIHSHLYTNGFYPSPLCAKLVWNWFVMKTLSKKTSSLRTLEIIPKKPQRNCTFMNSASWEGGGKGCPNNGKDSAKMRAILFNSIKADMSRQSACNTATSFWHFRQKVRKPCKSPGRIVQWIGRKNLITTNQPDSIFIKTAVSPSSSTY